MPRRGQHYVPIALQKGFLIRGEKKTTLRIARERGAGERRNIESLWAGKGSKRPYSTAEDANADGAFTKVENEELSHTIHCLRTNPRRHGIEKDKIGRLITHLLARSKPNIENMDHIAEALEQLMYWVVKDKNERAIEDRTRYWGGYDEQVIGRKVSKWFVQSHAGNENIRVLVEAFAKSLAGSVIWLNKDIGLGTYDSQLKVLDQSSPHAMRRKMVANYLAREPVPLNMACQFTGWNWRMVECRDMILGDAMVFFHWQGKGGTPTYTSRMGMASSTGLHSCYLPLSTTRVLMGSPKSGQRPISWASIRKGVATTTGEFFIGGTAPPEADRLTKLIGRCRHEVSQESWCRLAEQVCLLLGVPTRG